MIMTVRVTTSTGAVVDAPSPAAQRDLVAELRAAGTGAFLVAEVREDAGGETYLQVLHNDAAFLVEFRAGSKDQHYRAETADPDVLIAVLSSWADARPEWRTALPWQQVAWPRWWQRFGGNGVFAAGSTG